MQTRCPTSVVEPVAELQNIHASYRKVRVLNDVSLSLLPSEIFVLMGPNGAGKTTLIRVLAARLRPTEGRLIGTFLNAADSTPTRLVPQDIALFPLLTARENCIAFAKMTGATWREAAALADRALDLTNCKDISSTRVGGLSGGFRRRVNIAVALVGNPKLLILDEPTVGIDADAKRVIAQTIHALKQSGMSILIVTHDFEDADTLADRAGFLFNGRLARVGIPRDLVSSAFGKKKRIEINFASPPVPTVLERLRRLGAVPTHNELSWEFFEDIDDKPAEYLAVFSDGSAPAREVRISAPGLGAFYRHLAAVI